MSRPPAMREPKPNNHENERRRFIANSGGPVNSGSAEVGLSRMFFTVPECAQVLGVSETTIWRRIKRGLMMIVQHEQGTAVRIPCSECLPDAARTRPKPSSGSTRTPTTQDDVSNPSSPRRFGPRPKWKTKSERRPDESYKS